MIAGPPLRDGSDHLTSRLVDEPEVGEIVGGSTIPGSSATSVRLMVTATVSLAVPSETLIVTE